MNLIIVGILFAIPSGSQAMDTTTNTGQGMAKAECPEGCIPVETKGEVRCDCPEKQPEDGGPIIMPSPIHKDPKSFDSRTMQQ